MTVLTDTRIAVLLPCYNEAIAIGETIEAFRHALPKATIYVCDNNSKDNTIEVAKQHGAMVLCEYHQGKGNVVRRMFAEIEADLYLMADGDTTYDASKAPQMLNKLIDERLDMVVGVRVPDYTSGLVYRRGHTLGNKLFTMIVEKLFGRNFTDIFSGYRAFSRRFVKSFPARSQGFEIESELTIHSLEQRLPCAEIDTVYKARPEGSTSKLNSYRDGFRILCQILTLLRIVRPLLFFSSIAAIFATIAILIFIPILITYVNTHLVPRFPTVILSTGLMLMAVMSFTCGLILDNVAEQRRELKRLFYLSIRR